MLAIRSFFTAVAAVAALMTAGTTFAQPFPPEPDWIQYKTLYKGGIHPFHPLKSVIYDPISGDPRLVTINLRAGEAQAELGPEIALSADCPAVTCNPPPEYVGEPLSSVDIVSGLAITHLGDYYGWGMQSGGGLGGSLLTIDPGTGSTCAVCPLNEQGGGFAKHLTASFNPREVFTDIGVIHFSRDTLWSLSVSGLGSLRFVNTDSGISYESTGRHFSDIYVHSIASGIDGFVYAMYEYAPVIPGPSAPGPILGFFDENDEINPIDSLSREDDEYFGSPTAMLIRQTGPDNAELILVADRSYRIPYSDQWIMYPPVFYRVPLEISPYTGLSMISPIVSNEQTYAMTIPELPGVPLDGLFLAALAQQSNVLPDWLKVSMDMIGILEVALDGIACGSGHAMPCPDPFWLDNLQLVQEFLKEQDINSAGLYLVEFLEGAKGCAVNGVPNPDDGIGSSCKWDDPLCIEQACRLQNMVQMQGYYGFSALLDNYVLTTYRYGQ